MSMPAVPDPGLAFAVELYIEAVRSLPEQQQGESEDLRAMAWQDIQERLAEGAEVNGATSTEYGRTTTLLAEAILHDCFDLAEILIAAGAVLDDGLGFPNCAYDAAAGRKAALQFLMRHGTDPTGFDREDMPLALETHLIPSALRDGLKLPRAMARVRRGGDEAAPSAGAAANPAAYDNPFYREQIRSFANAYAGAKTWLEPGTARDRGPIFSFERFGRSITKLPDGRMVFVAGEHEDSYDPDFCIYNDVCVMDGKGGLDYYLYAPEVFPPTDFHTATLVGDAIWIIGCLGYRKQRQEEVTPVFKLDVKSFTIKPVETSGDNPGWICRHTAVLEGNTILIAGGKIGVKMRDNPDTYALNTKTLAWSKL